MITYHLPEEGEITTKLLQGKYLIDHGVQRSWPSARSVITAVSIASVASEPAVRRCRARGCCRRDPPLPFESALRGTVADG